LGELAGSRVFVTGATGFIGANMVRRLLIEGASVHALVRPGANLWRLSDIVSQVHLQECDLLDFSGVGRCVALADPDIIYHFAFPGGHNSDFQAQLEMLSTGLLGTYALLSAASTNHVKHFIHIGSSTEYHPGKQPHGEDELIEPVSIRGVGKAASTLLCQQYAHQYDLNIVILRLFTVYGPWEQPERLIPTACRAILQDMTLPLTLPGLMHDRVFVEDMLDASVRAASHRCTSGEIINIGSGEQHTNEEIVHILEEIAGRNVKIAVGAYAPRPFDGNHWVADITRARDILGWQPLHSLRSGLEATYRFWQAQISPSDRKPGR
jgi:nucleoside-diphosphate-sugar epimerase